MTRVNIRNSAEIHFHQQEQVSVYFETNASGVEQEFGEIALMTCFSIRILSNLGVNDASDMLAQFLVNAPRAVEEIVSGGSTGGFELIKYPGYKGRRQFILNMVMNDSQFKLDLSQLGFGFLARGYGYYAPIGVFALLRFLAGKRPGQDGFLNTLGLATQSCGCLHLQRRITLVNHPDLAMAVLANSCGEDYLDHMLAH
jgi:hypothetical protein